MPPRLTRNQVREVDRLCIEELQLPGLILMEHAALALLGGCRQLVGGDVRGKRFTIVCGGGNNGGDGYALARHLHNHGASVTIFATKEPEDLDGDAKVNATICGRMGLSISLATPEAVEAAEAEVVVDALLGTGLTQPPREDAADLIRAMNGNAGVRLAVDIPSGLDCDTGRPLGPPSACVRADLTVTLVAEKVGFPRASAWVGEVIVGDIGAPPEVVERAAKLR